jgi:hypothetical protein
LVVQNSSTTQRGARVPELTLLRPDGNPVPLHDFLNRDGTPTQGVSLLLVFLRHLA